MHKRFAPVLLALLASCAVPPPTSQNIALEAGPKPSAEVAEKMVREYLARNLKDPDSLKQFAMTRIFKKQYFRGYINGGGYDEGWMVCYEYNAKNSYGAYGGLQQDGMMLRGSGESWYQVPGLWGKATGDCQN